ncbi:hypothetical protein EDD21DRAFT_412265 [Dissophora ornata]|nr:hypothetical protein EDD21DRAFT_412265 [Dissophora ornata]
MTGVPRKIVDRAEEMAEEFELKQDTKREEERRTQRWSKNVGQWDGRGFGVLAQLGQVFDS